MIRLSIGDGNEATGMGGTLSTGGIDRWRPMLQIMETCPVPIGFHPTTTGMVHSIFDLKYYPSLQIRVFIYNSESGRIMERQEDILKQYLPLPL
jgi:hypothetical protein